MSELTYNVPVFNTLEELEKAIERYKASDLKGNELLRQWQAIRDASLNRSTSDASSDRVPGQDSY